MRYLLTRARKATAAAVTALVGGIVAGVMNGGDGLTEAELVAALGLAVTAGYATWRTPNVPAPIEPYRGAQL